MYLEVSKGQLDTKKTSKDTVIRLEGENIPHSTRLFHSLQTAEISCALLGLFGFGCFAIGQDLQYTESLFQRKEAVCSIALCLGTLSTLLLLAAVWRRCRLEFRWQQAKCVYSQQDSFLSSKKYWAMLAEWAVILPHPMIWLQGLTVSYSEARTSNPEDEFHIEYPINGILCVWSLLRQYLLLRLLFIMSTYSSPRAQRVCRMNGGSATRLFALRCMMLDSPYTIVGLFLLLGVLSGTFAIRLFERPAFSHTGMDFSSYANSMWYCLVTITTVGYGDYYPVTLPGRVVALVVCLWGIINVAVMIVFITKLLDFGTGERNALDILQRLDFMENMRQAAANVLTVGLRYCLLVKKHPEMMRKHEDLLGRFRRFVYEFEKMRVNKRKLYNQDTWEERMQKQVRSLTEDNMQMQQELSDLTRILRNIRDTLLVQSTDEGVR